MEAMPTGWTSRWIRVPPGRVVLGYAARVAGGGACGALVLQFERSEDGVEAEAAGAPIGVAAPGQVVLETPAEAHTWVRLRILASTVASSVVRLGLASRRDPPPPPARRSSDA